MDPHRSKRRRRCVQPLLALLLVSCSALFPNGAAAEGALAVGLPLDVAEEGFTYGYVTNRDTAEEARDKALDLCRTTKDAARDPKLRSLCKVVEEFKDQCVAVAWDPAPGTPGVGWAVADDLRTAEKAALDRCVETAGASRRSACVVDKSRCDGNAN